MDEWTAEQREAFGKRLRDAREKAGLTLAAVAFEMGLKVRGTPHLWEKGKNIPSAEQATMLADLFKVSVEWLVTGNDAWPFGRDVPPADVAKLPPKLLDEARGMLKLLILQAQAAAHIVNAEPIAPIRKRSAAA